MAEERILAIVGPTASGKTRRAVDVAHALGGEIVSGDSRQVYRGMDLGTGKEQHISITASTNMSKEDIDKAVKEAEVYAEEDKKRREEVDLRNEADSMVYQTEKSLNEFGDKVTAEEKGQVQPKIDALKEALKGTDAEKIKSAKEELQTAFYAIAERVYKEQGAAANAAAGASVSGEGTSSSAGVDDNVVDVDYKDAD